MIPTEVGLVVQEQIKRIYVADINVGNIHIEKRLRKWRKGFCQ